MGEISVRSLRCNIAQMRKWLKAEDLARLAVQVQGGIEPSLHLIVKPRRDGLFDTISGHRRWLAVMLGHIVLEGKSAGPDGDFAAVMGYIQENFKIDEKGWMYAFPEKYIQLAESCPESLMIPIEIWDGSKADEVLLLIKANVGAEEPDLVGMGRAFIRALEEEVTFEQLAQTTGMPIAKVQAIAEVPLLSEQMQKLIRDGKLNLSVVPDIVRLDRPKMIGLYKAVEEHLKTNELGPRDNLTNAVQVAINNMAFEPGELDRKKIPVKTYNEAAIADALLKKAKGDNPEVLYQYFCQQALVGYGQIDIGLSMLEAMAGLNSIKPYVERISSYKITVSQKALELLPEDVSCESCVYAQLPEARLKDDFEVWCRQHKELPEEGRCIDGVPASAKFAIRLPWWWNHPKSGQTIHTSKALINAWEKQRELEAARPKVQSGRATAKNVEDQRGDIAQFMARHTLPPFNVDHPWATRCEMCKWHLEESPLKGDPDAPHCHWAKGRRLLNFEAYVPSDQEIVVRLKKKMPAIKDGVLPLEEEWEDWELGEGEFMVPACRQYAPNRPWSELIPTSPGYSTLSREAILKLLRTVAEQANRNIYDPSSRAVCQWLYGRPEKEAHHGSSFTKALQACQDELAIGQLWTLLQWALLDYDRMVNYGRSIHMPLSGGGTVACQQMDFFSALLLLVHGPEEEARDDDVDS